MSQKHPTFDWQRFGRRTLAGIGLAAAVFSVVMCVLAGATFLQLKLRDPLASPALTALDERFRESPEDAGLKEEIRALDLLARRAYFSGREQVALGGILILCGAGVFVFAAVGRALLTRQLPASPRGTTLPDRLASRLFSRRLVAIGGTVLFLASLLTLLVGLPLFDSLSSFRPAPGKTDETTRAAAGATAAAVENAPLFALPKGWLSSWPNFRGPYGQGIAAAGDWPLTWDGASGRGILWKKTLPKPGKNSPVVFGNRVFLSGADRNGGEIYCLDAATGADLFTVKVPYSTDAGKAKVTPDVGYAAPTIAVNGEYAAVLFATGDLGIVNFEGEIVWRKNLGIPDLNYGFGSSLMTLGTVLFVQYDHKAGARLFAFTFSTGEALWEIERDVLSSWATPMVAERNGKPFLVLSANPFVTAYHPGDGQELWSVDLFTGEIGSSPAFADGLVFAGNETSRLAAMDAVSGELRWEYWDDLPDVSSPVALYGLLFFASSGGVVTCLETASGEVLWKEEFEDGFYASPVAAGDRLYFLDREGVTHVIRAARTFEILGTSPLGERADASPAFAGGRIFIRGNKSLYCIGRE